MNHFQHIRTLLFLSVFIALSQVGWSQTPEEIDALQKELRGNISKKERTVIYNRLGYYYQDKKIDVAIAYCDSALELARETDDQLSIFKADLCKGRCYYYKSEFEKSLEFLFQSIDDLRQMGQEGGQQHAQALLYIGDTYWYMKEHEHAKEYYERALKIGNDQDIVNIQTQSIRNLGWYYLEKPDLDSAIAHFKKALNLIYTYDSSGAVAILNDLGLAYEQGQQYEKAIYYYKTAMEQITEQNPMSGSICSLYGNIGVLYRHKGELDNAREYLLKCVECAERNDRLIYVLDARFELVQTYETMGDYKAALKEFRQYAALEDSLFNKEKTKEIGKLEAKAEFDKQKAIEEAEHRKELEKQEAVAKAERERQNLVIFGVSLVLSLVVLFSIFLFRRFRITSRQKRVIEEQKAEVDRQKEHADQQREIVEEKNKEILDSINYAKRLQNAILPAPKLVKEYLGESFILYKPKDIVAGDFYWMESFASASAKASDAKGWTYIAAADCTGHGVPGAMVSVVCSNALSKALIEEGISDTGKLLDRTRELVIERFGKSDSEIKDGMDISLAAIRHDGKQVRWSGANNPLWLLKGNRSPLDPPEGEQTGSAHNDPTNRDQRPEGKGSNSDSDSALIEIKPDKQPIGKYAIETPFTQHIINIEPGDTLYMFTDGYIDQFGGKKGKKFKSAKLKSLLLSIQDKSLQDQQTILDETFEEWKGDLEQIDDVCIIGVKL